MGSDIQADLPIVMGNLDVAQALGQLHLDFEDRYCTGFVGWIRLTPEQLLYVAREKIRVFEATHDVPNAPVCFLMEQMATKPGQLQQRMRWLSALPGVEILAGWRGQRLRVHRVRGVNHGR